MAHRWTSAITTRVREKWARAVGIISYDDAIITVIDIAAGQDITLAALAASWLIDNEKRRDVGESPFSEWPSRQHHATA